MTTRDDLAQIGVMVYKTLLPGQAKREKQLRQGERNAMRSSDDEEIQREAEEEKAGTSSGAKKGWEVRKHGQFSTKESHAEYMGLHQKLLSAIEKHRYSRHDAEKEYHKNFQPGKHFSKVAYDQHRKNQSEADRETTTLKNRQKEMESSGQHEHPEWGKFTRKPKDTKTIGGSAATYISPKGHEVKHYGFGGWSMQRVAPHYSVESEYGKKEWSGDAGSQASKNFLKKVYGIGATDEEKNEDVKFKKFK